MDPIPFITTGQDGIELIVNPSAIDFLRKIKKPIIPISVVGLYRTGKSFLLNLLMGRTSGFPLGGTVEASTKGIWMWAGDHPGDKSKTLLLLDTEGLHDPDKSDKSHDTAIFTLAVVLSSALVYNSKGTIDSNALEVLELVTQLTNHITFKTDTEEEEGEEFSKLFPTLVWTVRDHFLELSVNGEPITSNEYLEMCLALKKGHTSSVNKANTLRETIRAFFTNRHCFVFPPPVESEQLCNLDKMSMDELKPTFRNMTDEFTKFILGQTSVKTVYGKALAGPMYATLAEKYVEAIANGNICIESSFDYMIKQENTKAISNALDLYKEEMDKQILPLQLEVLNMANEGAQTKAIQTFNKFAVNNEKTQGYVKQLNEQLNQLFKEFTEKNRQVSLSNSIKILEKLFEPITKRLESGEFHVPGGHREFCSTIDKLNLQFQASDSKEKGPFDSLALAKFHSEKVDLQKDSILMADAKLSEEEKISEALRQQNEEAIRVQKILEQEMDALEKEQQNMEATYQRNLEENKAEFERQHEKSMLELQKNFEENEQERVKLMNEGFKEQANLMKEQLEMAQKEIARKEELAREQEVQMREEMKKQMETMKADNESRMEKLKEARESSSGGILEVLGNVLGGVLTTVLPTMADRFTDKLLRTPK